MQLIGEKKKLNISTSLRQGKRLTSNFLRALPDLSGPGLTDDERHEIRLSRIAWVQARQSKRLDKERASEIVALCSHALPTAVMASLCGVSVEWIRREQGERGVELTRPERRRIEQQFDSSRSCPFVAELTRAELKMLRGLWEDRHRRFLAVVKTREERSLAVAEKILDYLRSLRAEMRLTENPPRESPCSGSCEEPWPRTAAFFVSNWRRDDKLADRCKYCTKRKLIMTRAKRYSEPERKRRHLGRRLRPEETGHVLEAVRLYSSRLPSVLLRTLFHIGNGTLARIRHEAGIELTATDTHRILWRWYFRTNPDDCSLLTLDERARLCILERRLRSILTQRFQRADKHIELLTRQAAQLRAEHARMLRSGGNVRPLAEGKCRLCGTLYPRKREFFAPSGVKVGWTCRVCVNYQGAQKRLEQLRRRFG